MPSGRVTRRAGEPNRPFGRTHSENRPRAPPIELSSRLMHSIAPAPCCGSARPMTPVVRLALVDPESLDAFRHRDASGVRAMYREYGRLVYAVAHRVLGQHELAEEATQQTFVRAWQAAERLDADRDPAPWLATIAKRAAIDIYRREARRSTVALSDVAADDRALVSLPPDLDTLDAVWHVRQAIDTLPADEAAIVRLQHL